MGTTGESYDNALAETINGLYKAEIIQRRGPWKTGEAEEMATMECVVLVQPPKAAGAYRLHPTGGVRGQLNTIANLSSRPCRPDSSQ
ncbi:Integrase, catalytic region [Variovorax sp. WDL1]|nr:Integrase, catalytic region [Variovorax sp. WDL1]